MTKKEYKKLIDELSANTFPHTYKALDTEQPHEESVNVVEIQKVIEILNRHVKRGENGKNIFVIKRK